MRYYIFYFLILLCCFSQAYAEDTLSNYGTLGDSLNDSLTNPNERVPIKLQVLQNRVMTGDTEALFEIGLFYFKGIEIERDIPKAIHYLTLAAEQKHVKALYNLASLYLDGSIVEQDIERGLTYLEKAVKEHYIPAQVAYAFLYLDGAIVAQDIEKAYTYLTLASYNKNITKEELQEINEYKLNIAQKLTDAQVVTIEENVKKGLLP